MIQVNNQQPSFQSARCSKCARLAMSERMPNEKFKSCLETFTKDLKDSPIDVFIDTVTSNESRLDAIISYTKNGKKKYFNYIEERKLCDFFNISPKRFLKRIKEHVCCVEESFNIKGT